MYLPRGREETLDQGGGQHWEGRVRRSYGLQGSWVPQKEGIERGGPTVEGPSPEQEDSTVRSHHGENVGTEGHRGASACDRLR